MLPSHGASAWKLEDEEAAPSRAKGSVCAQPSPSVTPQPEKLLPLVMGSRVPPSDMTGAAALPSYACDVVTGRRKSTMAHSGLACAFPLGPGFEKAQASTSLGSLNPLGSTPSLVLGHESPICSLRRRRGALASFPAPASSLVSDKRLLKEVPPQMDAPPPANGSPPPGRSSQPLRYDLSAFDLPERGVLFFYSFLGLRA